MLAESPYRVAGGHPPCNRRASRLAALARRTGDLVLVSPVIGLMAFVLGASFAVAATFAVTLVTLTAVLPAVARWRVVRSDDLVSEVNLDGALLQAAVAIVVLVVCAASVGLAVFTRFAS